MEEKAKKVLVFSVFLLFVICGVIAIVNNAFAALDFESEYHELCSHYKNAFEARVALGPFYNTMRSAINSTFVKDGIITILGLLGISLVILKKSFYKFAPFLLISVAIVEGLLIIVIDGTTISAASQIGTSLVMPEVVYAEIALSAIMLLLAFLSLMISGSKNNLFLLVGSYLVFFVLCILAVASGVIGLLAILYYFLYAIASMAAIGVVLIVRFSDVKKDASPTETHQNRGY